MGLPIQAPAPSLDTDRHSVLDQPLNVRSRRHAVIGAAALVGVGMAWLRGDARAARAIRVGMVKVVAHAALNAAERGFVAALADSGFREGEALQFERRDAAGDIGRLAAIAQAWATSAPTLIHAVSTPAAQAVVKASRGDVPIVFSAVTNPVAAGIVPADRGPGQSTRRGITGVSDPLPTDLQLRTYAAIVPTIRTWGVLYNPNEVNSVEHVRDLRSTAQALGLNLIEAHVARASEVAAAANALASRVQAIFLASDNTTVAALPDLVAACRTHKAPLFAGDTDSVFEGAVLAYGLDYFLVGYAAGKKASLVLKGLDAGDIPWGPMERFSLVVNPAAAHQQGIELPPQLLARADHVVKA
jgi:putative tryptophan/tyrosine transport system substrate-binding protein